MGVFFDYLQGLVGYEAPTLFLVLVPIVAVPVAEEVFVIVVPAVLFAEGGPFALFVAVGGVVAFTIGEFQTSDEQLQDGDGGLAGFVLAVFAFVADAGGELLGQVDVPHKAPGELVIAKLVEVTGHRNIATQSVEGDGLGYNRS